MNAMSRWLPTAAVFCCLSVLASVEATAQLLPVCDAYPHEEPGSPILPPGADCAFDPSNPDVSEWISVHPDPEELIDFPPELEDLTSFSFVATSEDNLSSALGAYAPIARADVDACHDHHFYVKGIPTVPGALPTSTVSARISGKVNARGFMAFAGMGQGRFVVKVEVVDRGEDGDEDRLIHSEIIVDESHVNELNPTIGGDFGLEIGSLSIIQENFSVGVGMDVPLCYALVDRKAFFGFDAPLQRGHHYTVRVRSTSVANAGLTGGLTLVSFVDPTKVSMDASREALSLGQNLMDPGLWLRASGLDPSTFEVPIPNIKPKDLPFFPKHLFTIPELSFHIGSIIDANVHILDEQGISNPLHDAIPSTHDILKRVPGIPFNEETGQIDLIAIVEEFFGVIDAGAGVVKELAELIGDAVPDAGVTISNLRILVEPDPGELDLYAQIERNLGRERSPVASFQLPDANGGHLERVRDVVRDLIDRNIDAGYDMRRAIHRWDAGNNAYANQDWKTAYSLYRQAYRQVIR